MTRVTGLAAASLLGFFFVMLSGGDAGSPIRTTFYLAGSTLFFGSVGIFCLTVRAKGGNEKIRPEAILLGLTLVFNLIVVSGVHFGWAQGEFLKFLKCLPAFGYFGLLQLTAVSLSGFGRSGERSFMMLVKLLFFTFCAADLERARIRSALGR